MVEHRAEATVAGTVSRRAMPSTDDPATDRTWRLVAATLVLQTAFGAAFPRLARRLRWSSRLRGRRLLGYVAFNACMTFALRAWLVPRLRAAAARHARMRESLAQELGREPSVDELIALLRRESAP
jgi:hypothetical protein